MSLALFSGWSWGETLLILIVILLLFGAKKLPELARSLGRSLSEFKKGKEEGSGEGRPPAARKEPSEDKPAAGDQTTSS